MEYTEEPGRSRRGDRSGLRARSSTHEGHCGWPKLVDLRGLPRRLVLLKSGRPPRPLAFGEKSPPPPSDEAFGPGKPGWAPSLKASGFPFEEGLALSPRAAPLT